jgi:flagellar biosynthesis/type III secretory pathway protein FliH
MILRNAVVSDLARTLDQRRDTAAPVTCVPPPPITPASAPEKDVPALAELNSYGLAPLGQFTDEPAPAPTPVPLTPENVAIWLSEQGAAVRADMAAVLADDIAQVYAKAERDGFEAGCSRGEHQLRTSLERGIELFATVAQKAQATFEDEVAQLHESCIEIIVAALAKMVGPLLATREAAVGAVLEVLAHVKEGREVTIRVSPHDHALVQSQQTRLAAVLSGQRLEVVADTRVDLGGCIVESTLGTLDGRLEVQLRGLFETLRVAKAEAAAA